MDETGDMVGGVRVSRLCTIVEMWPEYKRDKDEPQVLTYADYG
jgi:hypothetical protein